MWRRRHGWDAIESLYLRQRFLAWAVKIVCTGLLYSLFGISLQRVEEKRSPAHMVTLLLFLSVMLHAPRLVVVLTAFNFPPQTVEEATGPDVIEDLYSRQTRRMQTAQERLAHGAGKAAADGGKAADED